MRNKALSCLTITLMTSLLAGCLMREPITPPTPDYLSPGASLSESVASTSDSQPDESIPTDESIATFESGESVTEEIPAESESLTFVPSESETVITDPLLSPHTPSESLPDPRETPTAAEADLGTYNANVIGYSYPPTQDVINTLAGYNAFAYGPQDSRTIYLSFNAGYEHNNGMSRTLDILAYYNIKASIFIDGAFIRTQNELTKRIAGEGHLVGNHTLGHIDLAKLVADGRYDEARLELSAFEQLYREVSGEDLAKIYRPPSSSWSERSFELIRREGYKSYLFSFTHRDWEVNNQPDPGETLEALKKQLFPGSLIMLHTVSETNALILEDFILYAFDAGYDFGLLPLD